MSAWMFERRLEQVYGAEDNAELRVLHDIWAGEYDRDPR